jgi:uncharacterized caspase-like protein
VLAGLGSLWLPRWAQGQSEGAARLLRRPKRALVIGNSRYRHGDALRNPGNDARALAAALRGMGFTVSVVLDAERAAMASAIDAHVSAVGTEKGVGLFYYAGHGLQLAWRNYLVPVDVSLRRIEDIPVQCLDASGLIQGLARAGNPMNVIILDACRENPFGDFRVEQKGLSQMDAAPGSLLAYATAPGNLASDGAGGNGLYTENLLRELQVPEAKIEDVFKRVRLGVRRASRGAQIPWESTSLEEDFYFLPPAALRARSQEEEEREFREELALYERAVGASVPAPLEAYLSRYPSGRFAELAQLRLDKVLAGQGEARVEPAPSAGNPFTAGTARADTRYRVGDRYSYRYTGTPPHGEPAGDFTATVTAITEGEVIINGGRAVLDLLGNTIRSQGGVVFSPRQDQPLEYAVGRRWTTRFTQSRNGELVGQMTMDCHITGREKVTVPAGAFDCFKVEMSGRNFRPGGAPPIDLLWTLWYAPDRVRRPVARDRTHRTVDKGHVKKLADDRIELVSFHQG